MREDMTPEPEDPYGVAKYAVEMDLAAAKRMFGLDSVVFRPHNVYGERQNTADRYRNVLGIFMNQILGGQPCSVFGDGEQTRAFTYISDVAPVIARAPEVPAALNQAFNIGADRPYTVNGLAKSQEAMGKKTATTFRPEGSVRLSDHAKSPRSGTRVRLPRKDQEMAEWVKKVGLRKSGVFQDRGEEPAAVVAGRVRDLAPDRQPLGQDVRKPRGLDLLPSRLE